MTSRALFYPRRVERDLQDELSFHIECETRKLIERGVPPDQARARAKAHFGSLTVVADECRDRRGISFVDNTARDVTFALRSFRRAPLSALTIVATVAIGLGVVATLFTILNTVLFRVDAVPDVTEMYAVERVQTVQWAAAVHQVLGRRLAAGDTCLRRCVCRRAESACSR